MPNCLFLTFWNFILVILLILTGIIVPVKVCLLDSDSVNLLFFFFKLIFYFLKDSIDPLDTVFDVLFGIDFILNFVCAYYDKHGFLVTSYSQIAINYLSGWFFIDLFALYFNSLSINYFFIFFFFYRLPLGTIINAMSSNQ